MAATLVVFMLAAAVTGLAVKRTGSQTQQASAASPTTTGSIVPAR